MNLKCNISNTDDPLKQIRECIDIINKVDKAELKNGEILNLDFSDDE
ncbi:MAG: hypothetical protein ABIH65_00095 [Nanoarchaeota archaeon]